MRSAVHASNFPATDTRPSQAGRSYRIAKILEFSTGDRVLSQFSYRYLGGTKAQLIPTARLIKSAEGRRLFSCPKLIGNELLSSWVGRVAERHDVAPTTIMQLWGFAGPSSSLDFAILEQEVLDRIARVTMHDPESIARASDLKSTILGQSDFLCLTNDMRLRRPIYRCCVVCLAEDRVPHFRYFWRLAYAFVCERHRCALIDSCFVCGELLDLTMRFSAKISVNDRHSCVGICNKCGAAYSTDVRDPLDFDVAEQMIAFQNWFHVQVTEGSHTEFGRWASSRTLTPLYLRRNTGKRTIREGFTGLDVVKLFGNQWQELGKLIPCLNSTARMIGA
ncbi:TniQ family protein [Paraburkholderia sp. SIMBA_053]|uniref:TniQ family protein n=1 Tax=Paraburkholderia sp. SIMBA_053 TaxID=3085794 RepID=UPI003979C1D1